MSVRFFFRRRRRRRRRREDVEAAPRRLVPQVAHHFLGDFADRKVARLWLRVVGVGAAQRRRNRRRRQRVGQGEGEPAAGGSNLVARVLPRCQPVARTEMTSEAHFTPDQKRVF